MTLDDVRIADLLARARNGDEAATNSLIGGVRERVVRWAMVVTGDADDAEDVAQKVSMTLHRQLAGFEARSSFTTWLYSVVRNAALDVTRNSKHKLRLVTDDTMPDPTALHLERIENQAQAELVKSFFTLLSSRQRELIELVDLQGYSAAEAAAVVGIEPETARVHLMRARRTLREKMLEKHAR